MSYFEGELEALSLDESLARFLLAAEERKLAAEERKRVWIARLMSEQPSPAWVPVEDDLEDDHGPVLTYREIRAIASAEQADEEGTR